MKLRFPLWCLVCALLLTRAEAAPSRYVVADFEDVATWRVSKNTGTPPGIWFAAGIFLGSSWRETCNDRYVGEIRYDFAGGTGSKELEFERVRMSETSAFIEAIGFQANPKGLDCTLAFDLLDSRGKTFRTREISLSGEGWQPYSLPVGPETVSGFEKASPPLRLRRILFRTRETAPVRGSVFLDDLTLIGAVSGERKITASPVYEAIAWSPSKPVDLLYRLRNAEGEPRRVTATVQARDREGAVVFRETREVELPAYGKEEIRFRSKALPIGPYAITLELKSGRIRNVINDWAGVFELNGSRINREGMAFGIQDLVTWQCEEENTLHREWMRKLGVDLSRVFLTGGRFESADHRFSPLLPAIFGNHAKDGIDLLLIYHTVPAWLQKRYQSLRPPDDLAGFEEHARRLGARLAQYPAVRMIEFWNEPEIGSFDGTLEEYIAMLRAFSNGLRSSAPHIRIGAGSTTGVDHPRHKKGFEDVFWKAKAYYDFAVFHSHGASSRYAQEHRQVEEMLRSHDVDRPIANTEAGERSGYTPAGAFSQAETLVRKITFARHAGTQFYIWFTLQDYGDMDFNADDSFGLITADNRPKPSLLAYNELVRQLANTRPAAPLPLHGEVTSHRFTREDTDEEVHVCWPSRHHNPALLTLRAKAPLRVSDLYGRELPVNRQGETVTIPVEQSPIYIRTRTHGMEPVDLSFVSYPRQIPVTAGENAEIPLTLTNRETTPVTFSAAIDGSGDAPGTLTLPAGGTGTLVLNTRMPPEASGQKSIRIALRSEGGRIPPLTLPAVLLQAYSVRRETGTLPSDAGRPIADNLPQIRLGTAQEVNEITHDPTIRAWHGPEDLSVRAAAVHDGQGILFLFDVTDQKHQPENTPARMWMGDSVQLAIEGAGGKTLELCAALTASGPRAWSTPSDGKATGWPHPLEVARHGTRTSYRLYVPCEEIGLKDGAPGTLFRFAFLVNENDGQGRVRWMHWFEGIGKSKDPAQYGFGVLR